jgi:hypothetical protein
MALIDFNTMTLNEIEQIENLAGRNIDSIMKDDAPRGRTLKAIIYTFKKRTDPNFTIEQAGAFSLQEASELIGGDDTDPKDE